MALAIPACLATALFGGWLLTDAIGGLGYFQMVLGFLYGYMIAEVALRITGRKRGPKMEILAGGCAFLGIPAGWLLADLFHKIPPERSFFFWHLTNPWSYVLLGVAVFGAINRIRNI